FGQTTSRGEKCAPSLTLSQNEIFAIPRENPNETRKTPVNSKSARVCDRKSAPRNGLELLTKELTGRSVKRTDEQIIQLAAAQHLTLPRSSNQIIPLDLEEIVVPVEGLPGLASMEATKVGSLPL